MADAANLPLPEGSLLLHIGPPKTGTTTVQGAFHARRAAVLEQGVRYVGRSRHSGAGVLAVTGRPSFQRDAGPPPIARWEELVREAHAAREPRLVLSSEFFADAEPPAIERIVEDLDRDRLHVVVTLRPLAAILPSQWQQYVQSFMPLSYDEWLDGVFNGEPGKVTPTFWRRHRHDALVARWAAAVGPENVTVVVIDEGDHEHVLRAFEALLGLRNRTLAATPDATNRSMTWAEIEAVRAVNVRFREAGLGNALYHRVMHFGASAYMKWRVPPAEEPRIATPSWALDRATEVEREMIAAIEASGALIVGDLATLVATKGSRSAATGPVSTAAGPPVCVPAGIANRMAEGVAVVGGLERDRIPERPSLGRFATYQLAGAVAARLASGALDLVRRRRRSRFVPAAVSDCLAPDEAAALTMRALVDGGLVTPSFRRVRWTWIEPPDIAVYGTRQLLGAVLRRAARRGRG